MQPSPATAAPTVIYDGKRTMHCMHMTLPAAEGRSLSSIKLPLHLCCCCTSRAVPIEKGTMERRLHVIKCNHLHPCARCHLSVAWSGSSIFVRWMASFFVMGSCFRYTGVHTYALHTGEAIAKSIAMAKQCNGAISNVVIAFEGKWRKLGQPELCSVCSSTYLQRWHMMV